jgi:hypothetical protein
MTDKQAKADRANALLQDPDLQRAFEDVKNRLMQEFAECNQPDEYLIDLKRCITMLGVVRKLLEQSVKDGKLEEFNAKQPTILGDLNVRH